MENYSKKYKASISFKREDLQVVCSYKIRGAYNRIVYLSQENLIKGVVCASAGNHVQGVAMSCEKLKIKDDFEPLLLKMKEKGFLGEYLNDKPEWFQFFGLESKINRLWSVFWVNISF
jgi:threonine dehydratase